MEYLEEDDSDSFNGIRELLAKVQLVGRTPA